MRTAQLALLACLVVAGCDALDKKVENPVAGHAPPRTTLRESEPSGAAALENPLVTASAEANSPGLVTPIIASQSPDESDELADSRTAAMVNGQPVLVSEILAPYAGQLAQLEAKLRQDEGTMRAAQRRQAHEELRQARRYLIERDLKGHIERKLLIGALREQLKPEQIETLEKFVGEEFDAEVERMMKKQGVKTRLELEQQLQDQSMSLAGLRDIFFNERLAMEYLGYHSRAKVEIGRPDLLRYYEQHLDDYAVPAKVKWQQLLISYSKHGGRQGAQAMLEKATAELRAGADFGEVVRKYSNGLNSDTGGQIGWTEAKSLADERLRQALFELPVGSVSDVLEDRNSLQVVRVNDRQPAGRVPFTKVQSEIKEKIEKEQRQKISQELLAELRQRAIITTMFDKPDQTAAATGK